MNNGCLVGLVERNRRLGDVRHDLVSGQGAEPLNALAELFAAEKLHHKEGHLGGFIDARVEDVDQVLALDTRGHAGFLPKALTHIGIVEAARQHELERAPPVRLDMNDLVDGAHAPHRNASDNLVALTEEDTFAQLKGRHRWFSYDRTVARFAPSVTTLITGGHTTPPFLYQELTVTRSTLLLIGLVSVLTLIGCNELLGLGYDYDYEETGASGASGASGGAQDGGICAPGSSTSCYPGPEETMGVGACKEGTKTCAPDGTGYGECAGFQAPVVEDCATPGEDESCDGEPACNGSQVWLKGFGDNGEQYGKRVAADAGGNVVITGSFGGAVNFGGEDLASGGGMDVFVAKLGGDGAHRWSKRFGDAENQYATDVAVDKDGNILVAGYFTGVIDLGGGALESAGATDAFVAKFNGDGDHVWSYPLGDAMSQAARSVRADAQGNVVLVGDYQGTLIVGGNPLTPKGLNDIFIVKLSPQGTVLFSKSAGGPGNDFAARVLTDAGSGILLLGSFAGSIDFEGGATETSNGGFDVVLVKLDPSGNYQWSGAFGNSLDDDAKDVAIDGEGSIVVAGDFASELSVGGPVLSCQGKTDVFVAKFDSSGGHVWSRGFGDAEMQRVRAIDVDSRGNIVVAGEFSGELSFGGDPLVSPAGADIFIAKLDPGGNPIWSKQAGDAGIRECHDIAVDGLGHVVGTGYFNGVMDFGGTPILSAGQAPDIFVAKLSP